MLIDAEAAYKTNTASGLYLLYLKPIISYLLTPLQMFPAVCRTCYIT